MQNIAGNVVISPMRAAYQRALEITGGDPNFLIQEKTLRLEQLLIPGRNSYLFDLFENSSSDRPGEKKLNKNDLFLIAAMALNVTKQVSASDPSTGNYSLYTFPDPNFFVGDPASGLDEYQCLKTIWNGFTTIKTSPVERVRDFHNTHFLYNPERGTIIEASPQVGPDDPQYGPFNESRGFYAMNPNPVIDGNENNTIELILAKGDTAVIDGSVTSAGAAATTRNAVVYLINGFVIVNGAKAQLKWF